MILGQAEPVLKLIFSVVSAIALLTRVPSIAPPDFSGHWVYSTERNSAPERVITKDPKNPQIATVRSYHPTFGNEFEIRQNHSDLVIQFPKGNSGPRQDDISIRLSGESTRNKTGPFWSVFTANWEGAKLTVTAKLDDPQAMATDPLVRSLELGPDDDLIVSTTSPASAVAKDVYSRFKSNR